ncbi:TlpA family protein disulfide reductase [Pedobacter sp. GR22-6]|uniref:TlpA family protein disulfide reductase n=1 Tax=Pedobacter sp. GR22-6 TaxID=3127957 RepID=UPI00307EEA9E
MKLFYALLLCLLSSVCLGQQKTVLPVNTIFKNDSVSYSGYLKGYSAELGFTTGNVIVNNIITGLQESYLINIHPDGTFSAKFPMHYPQEVFVRMNGAASNIYCEPGKSVFQVFNLKDKNEKPKTMGDLASINHELASARHLEDINYQVAYRENFSPDEYKQYYQKLMSLQISALDKFRDSAHISDKAYRLLKSTIVFKIAMQLFEYKDYCTRHGHPVISPDANYYREFLKDLNINDPYNCESTFFRFFINRLKFIDLPGFEKFQTISTSSLLNKLKTYLSFTQEELKVMAGFPETIDFLDEASRIGKAINIGDKQKKFLEKYEQQMIAVAWEYNQKQRYSRLKQLLNVPDGLAIDIMKTQDILQNMEDFFLPYNKDRLNQIKIYMDEPYFYAYIIRSNERVKKKIEENSLIKKGFVVNQTGKNPADSLYEKMMRKFEGKVVYLDFWATWCAPCIDGIERIEPLKKEFENEKIAFVYVTNQTSPLTTYNNRIPAIKGEHFRISTDEWNILSSKFKVGGIPHAALIDKKGNVIDANVRQTDPESLRKRFQELIKQ